MLLKFKKRFHNKIKKTMLYKKKFVKLQRKRNLTFENSVERENFYLRPDKFSLFKTCENLAAHLKIFTARQGATAHWLPDTDLNLLYHL